MSDWPKKMWLNSARNACFSNNEPWEGDMAVLVYPATGKESLQVQSPKPVAWRIHDPVDSWRSRWREMHEPQELRRDEAEAGFLIEYAYLAPPSESDKGEVVVTTNGDGIIVAVTRQDSEGRALSVIAKGNDASDIRASEREQCRAICEKYVQLANAMGDSNGSRMAASIQQDIRELGDE